MNFASDNVIGVHPRIIAALNAVNDGVAASYGADAWTQQAEARLSEVFECQVSTYFMVTGTAANALALSAMAPPYGAVLCHGEAHIMIDECGAPELFSGGAKLVGLAGAEGKITAKALQTVLEGFGERHGKPAAISITQATELGTVYAPDEIKAISDLAHRRNMRLHMDGARFANALVSLDTSPADLTWKSGVDAMSFGATKNGAMALEAVILFDLALAEDFAYRHRRAGQQLSKGRFLGAQMLAYLDGDLWLDSARHANAMAQRLSKAVAVSARVRLPLPTQANEVFAIIAQDLHDKLIEAGVVYHLWPGDSLGADNVARDEVLVRFVTSYLTHAEDIDRLVELMN